MSTPLSNFLASGVLGLGEKLGPILWQFPPNVMLKDDFRIRHAFEFRHPSFMNPDFAKLMRSHGVAIVFAHSGGEKAPYFEDVTADFIYARMHGQETKFKKGYTDDTLAWFAKRVESWASGRQPKDAQCIVDKSPPPGKKDAYIYFDTEEKKYALQDALNFAEHLGIKEMSQKFNLSLKKSS